MRPLEEPFEIELGDMKVLVRETNWKTGGYSM